MTLTLQDVSDGDRLRMNDGEIITVRSLSEWYEDRSGRHDGPWVTIMDEGRLGHRLLADAVEVVEKNPNRCKLCGGGSTAKRHDLYPYCRDCHYTGAAAEDVNRDMIADMAEWSGADNVGIWHTGGGCFQLTFSYEDLPHYHWAATDGEAVLPSDDDGNPIRDGWGIVCRYYYDNARYEESERHPDYEGTLVIEPDVSAWANETSDRYWNEYPKHCLTDRQVAEAIRADHDRVKLDNLSQREIDQIADDTGVYL